MKNSLCLRLNRGKHIAVQTGVQRAVQLAVLSSDWPCTTNRTTARTTGHTKDCSECPVVVRAAGPPARRARPSRPPETALARLEHPSLDPPRRFHPPGLPPGPTGKENPQSYLNY